MPPKKLTGKSSDLLRVVLPAAARGDLPMVRSLIEKDDKWLFKVGPHGRTMLWEACYKNRVETARYLIDNGADVNAFATFYTPMIVDLSPHGVARRARNQELADLLAECGAMHDLHTACYFGDLDQAARLLDAQPELVNSRPNGHGGSPVHVADTALNRDLQKEVDKIELELADAFAADLPYVREQMQSKHATRGHRNQLACGVGTRFRKTLWRFADLIRDLVHGRRTARNRHAAIRQLHRRWRLIWLPRWSDAVRDLHDEPYVHAPLHYAVVGKQPEMLALLIDRGADVRGYGRSLLKHCDPRIDTPMFEMLVKNGADASEVAGVQWIKDPRLTALAKKHRIQIPHIDAFQRNRPWLVHECTGNHNAPDDPARVQHVLDLGANVNATDYKGKTALHRSAQAGFLKITRLLIKAGADLELRDDQGETPIFDAVRHGRIAATELLIASGASVDVENRVGRTLEQIAGRSKKKDADQVAAAVKRASSAAGKKRQRANKSASEQKPASKRKSSRGRSGKKA